MKIDRFAFFVFGDRLAYFLTIKSQLLPLQLHSLNREQKKNQIPETKTEEGSSRRNIMRKHDYDPLRKEKKQGGGAGGKGKWNDLDDGSMDNQ